MNTYEKTGEGVASSLAVKSESEEMSTAPNLSGGRGALAVLACRVPLGVADLSCRVHLQVP